LWHFLTLLPLVQLLFSFDWGGEEGWDDWEGKEPRTVVAIDNGRGTAIVGSSIVEDRRTDVSPLPGSPVVPLKAVVVA